jgi:hypothetical protein
VLVYVGVSFDWLLSRRLLPQADADDLPVAALWQRRRFLPQADADDLPVAALWQRRRLLPQIAAMPVVSAAHAIPTMRLM